jgi:hypothetical protein
MTCTRQLPDLKVAEAECKTYSSSIPYEKVLEDLGQLGVTERDHGEFLAALRRFLLVRSKRLEALSQHLRHVSIRLRSTA